MSLAYAVMDPETAERIAVLAHARHTLGCMRHLHSHRRRRDPWFR
jgi:hypothetical protein